MQRRLVHGVGLRKDRMRSAIIECEGRVTRLSGWKRKWRGPKQSATAQSLQTRDWTELLQFARRRGTLGKASVDAALSTIVFLGCIDMQSQRQTYWYLLYDRGCMCCRWSLCNIQCQIAELSMLSGPHAHLKMRQMSQSPYWRDNSRIWVSLQRPHDSARKSMISPLIRCLRHNYA